MEAGFHSDVVLGVFACRSSDQGMIPGCDRLNIFAIRPYHRCVAEKFEMNIFFKLLLPNRETRVSDSSVISEVIQISLLIILIALTEYKNAITTLYNPSTAPERIFTQTWPRYVIR